MLSCRQLVKAIVRPVGSLILKGKSKPLVVYEPITAEDGRGGPERDGAYEAAFALLRQRSPDASEAFERLAGQRPQDPLVRLHRDRLRSGQEGDTLVLEEK